MKKSELRQLVKEAFEDFIKKNNEEETEVMDAENQPEEVEAEEESPIKGDLQAIADAAGKAVAAFKGDEELEDWVKSHIAAAKELITHAADFLGSDEDAEEGAEEIEDNEEAGQEVDSKSIVGPDGLNEVQSEKQKAAFAKMLAAKNPKKKSKEELSEGIEDEIQKVNSEIETLKKSLQPVNAKLADLTVKLADLMKKKSTQPTLEEAGESKEEPKKDVKVKKVDAQKVKDFAKEMSTKGEHTQVLKMIKKLETYVKTHINKEEDSK